MLDLVYLRQQGIILEVISEWGPWGQCEKCIHNVGIRTRRGYCRLKRQFDKVNYNITYKMLFNEILKMYK